MSHLLPGRAKDNLYQEWTESGGPHGGDALNEGFLGTAAPRYADVVLLLEIGMGVALLIGAVLARKRRFRLHAWCQSAIVLLNLVVIVLVMVPSFQVHVSPKIPAHAVARRAAPVIGEGIGARDSSKRENALGTSSGPNQENNRLPLAADRFQSRRRHQRHAC